MKSAERSNLPDYYEFGQFKLDTRDQMLFRGGEEVHLAPKAVDVLLVLLMHHGHVVEKDDLMRQVWPETIVEENNLTRTISTLRKVIDDETEEGFIETVPKRGYRFIGEAREINDQPPQAGPGNMIKIDDPESLRIAGDSRREVRVDVRAGPESASTRDQESQLKSAPSNDLRIYIFLVTMLSVAGLMALIFWKFDPETAPDSADAFPRLQVSRLSTAEPPSRSTISPDGRYIAYTTVNESGQECLMLKAISSDHSRQLTSTPEGYFDGLSISRDGREIYFTHVNADLSGTLFRMDLFNGGQAVKLHEIRTGSPAAVSVEGRSIAFVRKDQKTGGSALVIYAPQSGAEQKLIERMLPRFISEKSRPAWSNDGKRIACITGTSEPETRLKITIIEASTANVLSDYNLPWNAVRQLDWMGERSLIFLADHETGGLNNHLWVMSLPDGELNRITNDLTDYSTFSLTSDLKSLVAVQTSNLSDIWIVPVGSSGLSRKINVFNDRREGIHGIDWTPDGRLVFSMIEKSRENIWIMNQDGTQRKKLTGDVHSEGSQMFPVVSPDGRHIIYVSEQNGLSRIWKVGIDGDLQTPVTDGPRDLDPHFTYDGKWITFTSIKSGRRALWKAPAQGGDAVQVYDHEIHSPVPSPTNSLIACGRSDTGERGQFKLAVFDINGITGTQVFDLPFPIDPPLVQWMPDGRSISYNLVENGISNIWKLPMDGSNAIRLTDLTFERIGSFAWSRDGDHIAIVRSLEVKNLVMITGLK